MTLKEILEEFDTRFCKLRSDGYMELVNHHAPDIKAFITTHVTEILEGLRLEKKPLSKFERTYMAIDIGNIDGHNQAKAKLDQKINNILK